MPIRINLLAEQQAAEEARRKDPIKRTIIFGSIAIAVMLLWVLMLHVQLKARRSEMANLDLDYKKVDEKAKVVRSLQAEAGDFESRIVALERYSTNRVLWANLLDAFQKVTLEHVRFKSISASQRYPTNEATVFFNTNLNVAFTPPTPGWKFWAGPGAATPVFTLASNVFKSFTNALPFSTNTLPYTTKMSVVSTNLIANTVQVKVDFTLPAVATEDIDVTVVGGDYANPPGASLDEFLRQLTGLPYFTSRLTKGPDRAFMETSPRPEPDMTLPNDPLFKRFTLKLKYENRVLTNE